MSRSNFPTEREIPSISARIHKKDCHPNGIEKPRHTKAKKRAEKKKRLETLMKAESKRTRQDSAMLMTDSLEEGGFTSSVVGARSLPGPNSWSNEHHDHVEVQQETVRVQTMEDRRAALKRVRDEQVEFVEPLRSRTIHTEDRAVKKRKLLHSSSDEHSLRARAIQHLPTKFEGDLDSEAPAGFWNPHNMCYRRSVMQSLVNNPIVVNWLQDYFSTRSCTHSKSDKPCVLCSLRDLVQGRDKGWSGTRALVRQFDQAIRGAPRSTAYEWTHTTEQADANELLLFLIQTLFEQSDSSEQALRGIFQTELVSEWTCADCSEVSTSPTANETTLSIAVPAETKNKNPNASPGDGVAPPTTLQESLAQYFSETIDDVRCAQCRSRRTRTRSVQVNAAPAVLFVHLKRFEANLFGGVTKNAARLPLEEGIELGRYLSRAAAAGAAGREPQVRYRLAAVVSHSGSLRGGHYVTFAEDLRGRVWRFDDEVVAAAGRGRLLDPQAGGGSFTPYILTYVRC